MDQKDHHPKAREPARRIFSVSQYNRGIERLLRREVPRVWVQGVITQLNVRGRIVYMTLAEFPDDMPNPRAVLPVCMWTEELEMYNAKFARLPTPFRLHAELKVAFLLEAGFYVPSGRFQPRVYAIDENFTLGELYQTRQKILEALGREGLLHKNKGLPLSPVPLRVGLITAPGSAAYRDFTSVLLKSGFSFLVHFAPARMQGDGTEGTVLKAFELLGSLPLDVVCLVRGGGARTDLVYFDSERICRAIAACPFPVLTGIGHEIDSSLADMVAHANKITPTDCARFLEGRLQEAYARLAGLARDVGHAWESGRRAAAGELGHRAEILAHKWDGLVAGERQRFRQDARRLRSSTSAVFRAERNRHDLNRIGLERGPRKILSVHKLRFANQEQRLRYLWRELKAGRRARLAECRRTLKRLCLQRLETAREALRFKDRLVKSADPANLLRLGYAILRNPRGEIVKGVGQAGEGEEIRGELTDGYLLARVLKKEDKP